MTPVPPPLPARKPRRRLARLAFPAAAALALGLGPLRVEVDFRDDAGRVPTDFEAVLRSGPVEKPVFVRKGRIHLLRGRWQEIEVTDLSYIRSNHPVRGGRMQLEIERNSHLKLKQAAVGRASIPQRGDPDPKPD